MWSGDSRDEGRRPRATAAPIVRWRVAALGKEFHVLDVLGHRWLSSSGRYVDSELLGPSTSLTVEHTEDKPGDWLYLCHVTDHMAGRMLGWYRVTIQEAVVSCSAPPVPRRSGPGPRRARRDGR